METSQGQLSEIIAELRSVGTDGTRIEVKAAAGGVPKDLWPTVSSFSNGTGGIVLLGLDEKQGFSPASGFNAQAIRDAVSDVFRPRRNADQAGAITPRPLGTIDIAEVDGSPIVVIDVQELPPSQKPAFVTAQGKEGGSYERVGDGDRRMSTYGIFLLSTNMSQPLLDVEPVKGAEIRDLDSDQIERFIARLRRRRPRSVADLDATADILRRHNVISADGVTPTLAGLLALGRYPQQFLPQAMVTFAVYPGRSKDVLVGETRMLDRRVIEGAIPVMVDDLVRALLQNLRTRRVTHGTGAADEPEIPEVALREAITNALTHRDYSPWALGEQVRVEMFPDRVEVLSPGGIWGGRRVIDLFDGSSRSRNGVLAALLADVPLPDRDEAVSENAGSGIPAMTGALGRAGLPAPRFDATVTSLKVTLDRHGLLNPDTELWLSEIGAGRLDARLQRALVLVHRGYEVDDQVLRAQLAMDGEDARGILRQLVEGGWLRFPPRIGEAYRPGTRLEQAKRSLGALVSLPAQLAPDRRLSLDERILRAIVRGEELSIRELAERTGATANTLRPRLRVLVRAGALEATTPPQSKNRKYRSPGQMAEGNGA